MSFFDFLTDEPPPPSILRPPKKGSLPVTMAQPGSILDAPPVNSAGEPWPTTPPPPTTIKMGDVYAADEAKKYQIPEDKASALQKRNKLESDVKNLALSLVKENVARKQGLDPAKKESLAFGGLNEEQYTGPIYRQGIGGISRITRQVVQQLGLASPDIEKRLRELEDLESQAAKAETQAPGSAYAPGSGKLESASQAVKDADEALKYAVTPEQKARIELQKSEAMKVLDPEGKAAQLQSTPPDTTGPNSILGAAEQAGIPERDFQDGVAEIAKKMGLNLDQEVQLPIALQRLLNSPDFADLRPEFEAIGQMPGAGQVMQGMKEGENAQQPNQMADLHAEERQILIKMANEQKWTWYEAIAFVLLSMVLKPGASLMLWNKQANAGARKAELVENRRKQQQLQYQQQQQAALAKEQRSRAAEMQKAVAMEGYRQYGQERDDQRTFRNHWLLNIQKAGLTRKKAEADPELKIMQKDVETWLDFAGKAAAAMDTKKANEYMQRAENAMNMMLKYRAGEPAEATSP